MILVRRVLYNNCLFIREVGLSECVVDGQYLLLRGGDLRVGVNEQANTSRCSFNTR